MREQLPALIIIAPLLVALIAPLISCVSTKALRVVVIGTLLVSCMSALSVLIRVLSEGTFHYQFGGWAPPWGIEYVLDPLSSGIATLISFISLVVIIYSGPFFNGETKLRSGIIHALYCLLTTGLMGMVLTGDIFNLYVFLEISSLSAYALIASGGYKATVAAFRYLLIGTVGASFYLLGIGYLYAVTGTLNMADLVQKLQPLMDSPVIFTAVAMLVAGMGIKMALFPMHGWLPDSYTYAPPPVTAFISGVMTKVSAYVLFRFFFYIFGAASGPVSAALNIIGWAAAIGIIFGSVMAITQTDFRRMLAYSSIAQIGYIILGLAIGNTFALIGAILHFLNHAVMKSCLFLVAGGVKWKTGEHAIEKYAELSRRMPLTMGAFLIAALSMVGLPPTAGFFSKWYLVLGAMETGMWPYIIVIIISSLLNAVYFFRVIEHVYMKKATPEMKIPEKGGELPVAMLVPIVVLGAGILIIGILNEPIATQILQYALPGGTH